MVITIDPQPIEYFSDKQQFYFILQNHFTERPNTSMYELGFTVQISLSNSCKEAPFFDGKLEDLFHEEFEFQKKWELGLPPIHDSTGVGVRVDMKCNGV